MFNLIQEVIINSGALRLSSSNKQELRKYHICILISMESQRQILRNKIKHSSVAFWGQNEIFETCIFTSNYPHLYDCLFCSVNKVPGYMQIKYCIFGLFQMKKPHRKSTAKGYNKNPSKYHLWWVSLGRCHCTVGSLWRCP